MFVQNQSFILCINRTAHILITEKLNVCELHNSKNYTNNYFRLPICMDYHSIYGIKQNQSFILFLNNPTLYFYILNVILYLIFNNSTIIIIVILKHLFYNKVSLKGQKVICVSVRGALARLEKLWLFKHGSYGCIRDCTLLCWWLCWHWRSFLSCSCEPSAVMGPESGCKS